MNRQIHHKVFAIQCKVYTCFSSLWQAFITVHSVCTSFDFLVTSTFNITCTVFCYLEIYSGSQLCKGINGTHKFSVMNAWGRGYKQNQLYQFCICLPVVKFLYPNITEVSGPTIKIKTHYFEKRLVSYVDVIIILIATS